MYVLNKLVWFFLNPATLIVAGGVVGLVLIGRGQGSASPGRRSPVWRRVGFAFLALTLGFFWFMSSLVGVWALGLPLERPYLSLQRPEDVPDAAAIVILGGGIGKKDELVYPEMYDGADRIWHGARLYKAGKAPIVVISGTNDLVTTVPLLLDFGVPREAIVVDNESRNTYENSRFVERLLVDTHKGSAYKGSDPLYVRGTNAVDALVVTSAWHLPRALGNFSKTGLRCSPAPCDFKAHDVYYGWRYPWDWIVPSADIFPLTAAFAKEWLGRFARK